MMFWLLLFLLPTSVAAETVVSSRIIRAGSIIQSHDLEPASINVSGAVQSIGEIVGLEAKTIIYPGRPILYGQVSAPSVIERNQEITLVYHSGGLEILTAGKALSRGSVGDVMRVLNLSSRMIISGLVHEDGSVHVEAAEK